jgi:hypothetical protein
MKKFLILCAAVAALGLVAVTAPANAATHKAQAVTDGQAVQIDLSARRRHRRHVYRYYRPRYRLRHYYGAPYYYAYRYYYVPRFYRYYYPYRYYYYRRPTIYFGFSF